MVLLVADLMTNDRSYSGRCLTLGTTFPANDCATNTSSSVYLVPLGHGAKNSAIFGAVAAAPGNVVRPSASAMSRNVLSWNELVRGIRSGELSEINAA